ncbi:hypothetical protein VCHC17A1_2604B, partial [Vibrio cholerae HC-17A1]
RISISS